MRWQYRDPLLVWLFPAAYAVHVLEEWLGGFPSWFATVGGTALPDAAFLLGSAAGLCTAIAAAYLATRREMRHTRVDGHAVLHGDSNGWIAIALAALVLCSGVLHLAASVITGSYSPGLFSSIVLYLPLSQLTLLRAWGQERRDHVVRGIVVGVLTETGIVGAAVTVASVAG